MRTRRRATIEDLRLAIDCLPRHTRVAMLDGIAANEIIAGAYATPDGVCPMLAAHRAGGRTNLISFAKAWDRFAFRDARTQRARRATERELRTLEHLLEASLADEERTDLGAAIAEHHAAVARRVPDIFARRLKPGRLRLAQRPPEERTPSVSRANVSSPIVS
jgi:hypothetical protein